MFVFYCLLHPGNLLKSFLNVPWEM
jgi:hypothetical protein